MFLGKINYNNQKCKYNFACMSHSAQYKCYIMILEPLAMIFLQKTVSHIPSLFVMYTHKAVPQAIIENILVRFYLLAETLYHHQYLDSLGKRIFACGTYAIGSNCLRSIPYCLCSETSKDQFYVY